MVKPGNFIYKIKALPIKLYWPRKRKAFFHSDIFYVETSGLPRRQRNRIIEKKKKIPVNNGKKIKLYKFVTIS